MYNLEPLPGQLGLRTARSRIFTKLRGHSRQSGGEAMAPNRLMTTDGSGDWVTPPYPASPSIHLIVKTRMFRSTLIATGVGDNPDWVERLKESWETKVMSCWTPSATEPGPRKP